MLERAFSSKFRKELMEVVGAGIHVVLLQDAPRSGKKPYDAFIVWRGWFAALEFKIAKGLSLNAKLPTDRQLQCLIDAEKAGGYGFVVIYMDRLKKVVFVHASDWKSIFDGKTSVSMEELALNPDVIIIERKRYELLRGTGGKGTKWDFMRWLKEVS